MNNLKALIVEDEILIRYLVKKILTEKNIDIAAETDNGEEAIELAKNNKFDLIFMDIKLYSYLTGFEAAKEISKFSNIPIIFMSAYDHNEDIKDLDIKNKKFFIEKPVTRENIDDILNKINS